MIRTTLILIPPVLISLLVLPGILNLTQKCIATATPKQAGDMNIDPKGLTAIKGYDLWFSSNTTGRWQIWCLDSETGNIHPLNFEMDEVTRLLDQFVPTISPAGTELAFAVGLSCIEKGPCNRDLYLANLDGTNVQRLTNSCADEYHPSWSPDGKLLAYHSGSVNTPECLPTNFGIWVIDLSTKQPRQLTNKGDYDPVWSPNGQYIAYHSAEPSWAIKVLDYKSCNSLINSCQTWIVTDIGNKATSASWINDNKIAFASDKDGDWDIYEIPVKHNKQYPYPTRLTDNDWDDNYPAVFDTRIILWQTFKYEEGNEGAGTEKDAEIYMMTLDDRDEIPLITGVGNARDGFLRHRP